MIYIDLLNNPPSKELIEEGEKLTEELKKLSADKRSAYINRHADYWKKLKSHYEKLSHDKCWYTEAKEIASNYHMDHFRPKNNVLELKKNVNISTSNNNESYWWLAFDWKNYRLAASIPNTAKNAYFPLKSGTNAVSMGEDISKEEYCLIDPTVKKDVALITFGLDGNVCPTSQDLNSWDAVRVFISIRVYNLNDIKLVDARKHIQQTCKTKIESIMRLSDLYLKNKSDELKQALIAAYKDLKKMTEPEAELSAVAINYIRNQNVEFIKKIVN